jgi:hypothetical protein
VTTLTIHHSDDYDRSVAEDETIDRDINALNDEMIAAGVRVFLVGLHHASRAKPLRAQPHGKVLITDGPNLETKEHNGALWVESTATIRPPNRVSVSEKVQ